MAQSVRSVKNSKDFHPSFHQKRSGKDAGSWVRCTAKENCPFGNQNHVEPEVAEVLNKQFEEAQQAALEAEFYPAVSFPAAPTFNTVSEEEIYSVVDVIADALSNNTIKKVEDIRNYSFYSKTGQPYKFSKVFSTGTSEAFDGETYVSYTFTLDADNGDYFEINVFEYPDGKLVVQNPELDHYQIHIQP
jgi:hypothetical protein